MNWRGWMIFIFLALVWGSSFILIKKALFVFDPIQVACLRLSVSAIAFFPLFIRQFAQIDWSKWRLYTIVGLAGSGIPSFLFPIAQTQISSSIAGVLNSLTPLFTLVLGILIFGATFSWSKLGGVLMGLVGAAVLILLGRQLGLDGNLWYGLFIVAGSVCYATSVNTVGTYLADMNAITLSAVSFFIVGIPAMLYLFTTDFTTVMGMGLPAWQGLGYVVILSLAGTVLASILFFKLVQITSPVFSSTVAYLIPMVALAWGVIDGEAVTLLHLLAMGLILSGVYLSRT